MSAAAVDWFATELELAATTSRFVTAIRPNDRMTIAVSASTSVKPCSPRRAVPPVAFAHGPLASSRLGQDAAAGRDRDRAAQAGVGLQQRHRGLAGARPS